MFAVCFAAGFDYSTKVLVCVHRRGTTNFVSGPIVVFARLMFIYILAPASESRSPPPPALQHAKYTRRDTTSRPPTFTSPPPGVPVDIVAYSYNARVQIFHARYHFGKRCFYRNQVLMRYYIYVV